MEFPVILIAGILGQKVAANVWSRALGSDPPDTAQESIRWAPLIAAGVLEGAFYKFFRMAVDRGLRTAVSTATGSWPGRPGEGE